MLYLLIDKGWEIELQCFSFVNHELNNLISYDQKQLFTKLNRKEYLKQSKFIFKIFPISSKYDPKSNLVIFLRDGTRIFIHVSKDSVKQTRIIYSPKIMKYSNLEFTYPYEPLILPSTSTNKMHLVKCSCENDTTLMIFESPGGSKE